MWDNGVNIHDVRQIRTRCNVWFGVGAIDSIRDIVLDMVGRDIKSVLVVTGSNSYKSSGAWGRIEPALKAAGITYAVYNEVTPNPTTGQVDTAVLVGRDLKAEAVIGMGGGSADAFGRSGDDGCFPLQFHGSLIVCCCIRKVFSLYAFGYP